ncbi:uncharacterized protein F4807DRAFT_212129 [Annulohypoxylon truncatum]|uniref:uncharacterized protein n=1 Tax=Annulohypoxylon truncatum TaxID=327061 RepID=UPI0020072516|nr:uncharacterized protein F4807DRAFT_212129 [Annulohypoxylon truncatum]KAI1207043.1 hypothetical protein F4807DRAFT_212129 [Annulohypoxylon truncatum]
MYTKATLISALLAVAEARFGQEQVPVAGVQALSNFGSPGEAATLAGSVPGVLLAAANPCDKLTLADKIVSSLGTDPSVIVAAQKLVAAEQNFNPFVVSVPNICGDATLPATTELRGIVPLVDPAVTGSDTENANSATSLQTPFDATGLSVGDVMKAQGFSNFTIAGATANAGASSSATTAAAAATTSAVATKCGGSKATSAAAASPTTAAAAATSSAASTTNNNSGSATNSNSTTQAGAGAVSDPVTGTFPGFQASSLGLDFGTCTPTVKFEESLNGRKAGEFTFQAQDPVVNKGQQEALNPNIIFNRICDQLVNVCNAAADAVTACRSAQTSLGSGAKDASTANAWNTALGFDGVNINPDNAPQAGLVGHT